MRRDELIDRIWERDPTVWTGGDEAKWLGWLEEPRRMRERVEELSAFADEVAEEGLDAVVLLGMGGSSLAPEVLRRTFRSESLHVLDTTHPDAIRSLEESIDLEHTLFVSSSKSGSTLETRSHTDYFWERTGRRGGCFVAITDPGSALEQLARERGFRRVVSGEPTIGGRYSALSPFGVVPAALMGIQIDRLLANAERMADACRRDDGNPGYELGRQLGTGWQEGRDKICIAETDGGFGLWAEQLLAESTGKHGKGLVPAPGESPDGPDRQAVEPQIADPYSLAGEFFRWEFAVAVAATYLEIDPFDQPDVQAAKDKTNEVLATGNDPEVEPEGSVESLLAEARPSDYLCVQAFVAPSPDNDRRIDDLARKLRRLSGLVVTHGYGPRYLHSTGQLHKGGPNTGLYLQVVDDAGEELPIPGRPFGFRRLIRAQAAGDYASLKERGRRVARIHLEEV
ncbi:MAG: transaldolase / glucose-6-phosphate isomerase [Actinomycetota bacterium]|jgi:transaldolase/glucose-6-phosphate isomerase